MALEVPQAGNLAPSPQGHDFIRHVIDTIHDPALVLDAENCITAASQSFLDHFPGTPDPLVGSNFFAIHGGAWDGPELRRLLDDYLTIDPTIRKYEVQCDLAPHGMKVFSVNARRMEADLNGCATILVFNDVTEQMFSEYALDERELKLKERVFELEDIHQRLEAQGAEVATMAEELADARDKAVKEKNLLQTILGTTPDLIALKDRSFSFRNANPAFCEFLGLSEQEIIGRSDFDLFPEDQAKMNRYDDEQVLKTGKQSVRDAEVSGAAGTAWLHVVKTPVFDAGGNAYGVLWSIRNINERKQLERELERLATTDPLTGVNNRRSFMATLEAEAKRADRYHRPLSVLMIDIDHFKSVNDTYGHAVGDQVLGLLAQSCVKISRRQDVIGRLGGEEFAVLVPESGLPGAQVLAERIRSTVADMEIPVPNGILRTSVSIGVTECRSAEESVAQALARADQALYRAKESGRNRVVAD